jgi:hypothetical protein
MSLELRRRLMSAKELSPIIIDARKGGVSGDAVNDAALMKVISAKRWSKSPLYMTQREAELVTDIGTAFSENDKIKDFTAFKYFTGLTEVPSNAFNKNTSLSKIEFPITVKKINNGAFGYTYSLNINIPDNITTIVRDSYVSNRGSIITIGSGLSQMPARSLPSDYATMITVSENNPTYDSRDNCNAVIETETNSLVLGCVNTVIPESVTSIINDAFISCKTLKTLTIPKGVTKLGSTSFEFFGCNNLKKIIYKGSLLDWFNINIQSSNSHPLGKKSGVEMLIDGENIIGEHLNIPDGVVSIKKYVFPEMPDIKSISIPSTVTTIDRLSFYGNSLTKITVSENNPVLDSRDNCNAVIITSKNQLVYGCSGSTIPSTVTTISTDAFRYSSAPDIIIIPPSIKELGANIFINSNITSVIINNSDVVSIASSSFNKTLNVYVPNESLEAYKTADIWSTMTDRIKPISELPQ